MQTTGRGNAGSWEKRQGAKKRCRELGKDAEILAVPVFLHHPHGAQSFGNVCTASARSGDGIRSRTEAPGEVRVDLPRCPGWILQGESALQPGKVLLGGHLHPGPSGYGLVATESFCLAL